MSFVLFHDMGNVFQNPKDMFPSFLRFRQPDRETCRDVSVAIGTCSFNYFSHAPVSAPATGRQSGRSASTSVIT